MPKNIDPQAVRRLLTENLDITGLRTDRDLLRYGAAAAKIIQTEVSRSTSYAREIRT